MKDCPCIECEAERNFKWKKFNWKEALLYLSVCMSLVALILSI